MATLPFDLPPACDPGQTSLRPLHSITRTEADGVITFKGQYVNDREQFFSVAATADVAYEELLNALVYQMRVCFEAVPQGARFEDRPDEVADLDDEDLEPQVEITMKLERASDIEAEDVVCGFFVDPDIDLDEVCGWKPDEDATWRVQMHVSAGRARVRVRSSGRYAEVDAIGADKDTPWLAADDTRVRVRGLQNGSSYYLRGGWKER